MVPKDQRQFYDSSGPSSGQIAADVGRVALNFLPGGKLSVAIKPLAGRFSGALVNAGAGAAFSATEQLRQGERPRFDQTGIAAGLSAAVPGAISLAGRAFGKSASNIVNKAFDIKGAKLKTNIKSEIKGYDTFSQRYLENGKVFKSVGSGLREITKKILPSLGKKLNKIAESKVGNQVVDIADEKNILLHYGRGVIKELNLSADDPLTKSINSVRKGKITWKEALQLKRLIYKVLPKNAYESQSLSVANQHLKNVARLIDKKLDKLAPGTGFSKTNDLYNMWSTAYEGLLSQASKGSFSLGEKILYGAGGLGGGIIGGIPGAVATGGVILGREVMQTLPARLFRSKAQNLISKGMQSKTGQELIKQSSRRLFGR